MDLDETKRAMLAKLAQSGLDSKDAKRLELKPYSTVQAASLNLSFTAAGFAIPYFKPTGKSNGFMRFRLLEPPQGFAGQFDKPPKYLQPPKTSPEVYLPPIGDDGPLNWEAAIADASQQLIVTEGELKAAAACRRGYVTLGLGGVWSWKCKREEQSFLPILETFAWQGRVVYICYDSDALTNPEVVKAENALARALIQRGAVVYVARLPSPPSKERQTPPDFADGSIKKDFTGKVGLDDYLLTHTDDQFSELLAQAAPWAAGAELHRLNEEVLYVQDPGLVMRVDTLQAMAPDAFCSHHYATRVLTITVANGKGSTTKELPAAREWLKWSGRAEVKKVTYAPGHGRSHEGCLNTWPGWGVTPVKGDIEPWKRLLAHLFAGFPHERLYFERWCACPLQNPGLKMAVACVMWGVVNGTGKSLIGLTLGRIYGRNFVEIDNQALESSFTEWAENKQFCLGDEVTAQEKRGLSTKIKNMITRNEIRIDVKYIKSFYIPDVINYYFTSNLPDAFFMDDTDRRLFVHEVKGGPLDPQFYIDYVKWMKGDGASALFHHLLHLGMGDFNPHAPAMNTAAKRDMLTTAQSGLGHWLRELRDCPDNVLCNNGWTLATADDLLRIYDAGGRTGTTVIAIAREMKRAGFKQIYDGEPIPLSNGKRVRLWIVRHKLSVKKPAPRWIAQQYEKEHKEY